MTNEITFQCDCCGRDYLSATDVRQSISVILPHGVVNWFDVCVRCSEKAVEALKELFPKGNLKVNLWKNEMSEIKPVEN